MTPLETGLLLFISLYTITFFHEAGHYITANAVGFTDVKIGFKHLMPSYVEYDVINFTKPKGIAVIVSGVLLSMFPVVLIYMVGATEWAALLTVIAVFCGFQDMKDGMDVLIDEE